MADQLQFVIRVDAHDGTAQLQRFEGQLTGVGKAAEKLATGGLSSFQAKLLTLSSAVAAAPVVLRTLTDAFDKLFGSVIKTGDELTHTSRRLGISVEDLSRFNLVAKVAGTNTTELGFAIRHLQGAIVAAEKPGSTMAAWFKAVGVNAKALQAENVPQQIQTMARALAKFNDDATKSTAISQFFGFRGQA